MRNYLIAVGVSFILINLFAWSIETTTETEIYKYRYSLHGLESRSDCLDVGFLNEMNETIFRHSDDIKIICSNGNVEILSNGYERPVLVYFKTTLFSDNTTWSRIR